MSSCRCQPWWWALLKNARVLSQFKGAFWTFKAQRLEYLNFTSTCTIGKLKRNKVKLKPQCRYIREPERIFFLELSDKKISRKKIGSFFHLRRKHCRRLLRIKTKTYFFSYSVVKLDSAASEFMSIVSFTCANQHSFRKLTSLIDLLKVHF